MAKRKKKYPCPLAGDERCRYGGNKRFDYGFVSGTAPFCRHPKQKTFVNRMILGLIECPLKKEQ